MTYYILVGMEPMPVADVIEWGAWYEDADRTVAKTQLADGRLVSTVFLGIDHSFGDDGPPVLFETLVFPACEEQDRYCTWNDALAGHERMVARLSVDSGS